MIEWVSELKLLVQTMLFLLGTCFPSGILEHARQGVPTWLTPNKNPGLLSSSELHSWTTLCIYSQQLTPVGIKLVLQDSTERSWCPLDFTLGAFPLLTLYSTRLLEWVLVTITITCWVLCFLAMNHQTWEWFWEPPKQFHVSIYSYLNINCTLTR